MLVTGQVKVNVRSLGIALGIHHVAGLVLVLTSGLALSLDRKTKN